MVLFVLFLSSSKVSLTNVDGYIWGRDVQIMSDKFVTTPSEHFAEGQTVVAKVTNVDESKQRMLLSLRLSDCSLGDSASTSFLLLCQCLEELQGIRSLMSNQGRACLVEAGSRE